MLEEAYKHILVEDATANTDNMESNIVLDGRHLILARARSRDEIQTMMTQNKRVKGQDKRNLYLAKEGGK